MAQFKPGDVVAVSSPAWGPWMIVESCEGKSAGVLVWFLNDRGHRETFVTAFLEKKIRNQRHFRVRRRTAKGDF